MSPQRSAALVEAGVFLQLSGDAEGAKVLFRQALTLDPTNAKAKVLLGEPTPPAPTALPQSPFTTVPEPVGNETFFAGSSRTPSPADVTVVGRPVFPAAKVEQRPMTRAATAAGVHPAAPDTTAPITGLSAVMMAEPREQVVGQALADRHRIAKHLADGAFDKALEVALERLKVDADDVDAHELAFDVLVAAGQEELARAQLGHLMEVAVLRSDVGRARRFVHELEHIEPEHPSLPAARELISQARLVETDSTLLDEALRSVL